MAEGRLDSLARGELARGLEARLKAPKTWEWLTYHLAADYRPGTDLSQQLSGSGSRPHENESTSRPRSSSGAPKPGNFPLGSLESRAAARAMAEDKDEGIILTLKGMPTLYTGERNEQP
jgi:hypothetical protein